MLTGDVELTTIGVSMRLPRSLTICLIFRYSDHIHPQYLTG